jgi:hypothetical protein
MATITGSIDRNLSEVGNAALVTWTPMTFAGLDVGAPVQWVEYADRCVQVSGTFGAAGSVTLEGSNDGVTYATLADPQGNALTITAAKLEQVLELPRYVRPRVTAGDGTTSLTVTICMRRVTRT